MRSVALAICVAQLCLVLPLLIRLGRGPSVGDRIVALNAISTECAIAVLFFALYADRTLYLDVAFWLVSFTYVGTFIWSRYLERGLL